MNTTPSYYGTTSSYTYFLGCGSAGGLGRTIGATLSMASKGATEAAGRLTSAADTKTIQPRGILAVTAAPTLGIVQLEETFRKMDVKG